MNKEELEQFLLSKPTNTELIEKLIEVVNKNEWHTKNPTKDGLYLCKVEAINSTYRVCEWRNEPINKYDRNWVGQGYRVIKWRYINE